MTESSTSPSLPHRPPTIAPYGAWHSPITAEQVAAGVRPLSCPRIVGDRLLWLEGLPEEGGRVAIVEQGADGRAHTLTPAPFNVRSRVHEYGGGAFTAIDQTIWFSNFSDNLVYQQQGRAASQPITNDSQQRHADFEPDLARHRLIAVREDHHATPEPVNSLVALPLDGGAALTLAEGHDFYAAPRLSPDGRRLAWLCWRHPLMPWEGTELWQAEIGADGRPQSARQLAGGPAESLCQPAWSPDGVLHVISDRSGFWNLYRVDADGTLSALCPMAAEFGRPMWQFAQSDYGFNGPGEIIARCGVDAQSQLLRIALPSGHVTPLETGYDDISELRVSQGQVLMAAGSPAQAQCVVRLSLANGTLANGSLADGTLADGTLANVKHLAVVTQQVLARSADTQLGDALLSIPKAIRYPSAHGRHAHAFFYAPHNAAFAAPERERPPLMVIIHGGPSSATVSTLRLAVQYWTSRGFAVLDVNYGGSTGFGRAYREQLSRQWGIVDVEDCVAGARYLAEQGWVDGERMVIRGGSAGGFTTLSALAFHRVFRAGASHYGVADLRALDADTHKFESRYLNDLIGPPELRERLYAERSPLQQAHRLSCPVIFFQGLDDKVVPPAQSETMAEAIRARGIPVAYITFEGEGHGFRRKDSLQRALEAELSFYAQILGFEPADAITPVVLS